MLIGLAIVGGINMSGSGSGETVLPIVSAVAGEVPTISKPEVSAPTELTTKDIIEGTGAEVLPTSTLTVHYTLMA